MASQFILMASIAVLSSSTSSVLALPQATSTLPTTTTAATATSTSRPLRPPNGANSNRDLILYGSLIGGVIILMFVCWFFYPQLVKCMSRPLYKGHKQTPLYREEWYHRDDPVWMANFKKRQEEEAAVNGGQPAPAYVNKDGSLPVQAPPPVRVVPLFAVVG
ncbi:hypothetical protein BC829DRAFT_465844 [Chytridium lagenaria]|nr:hypothetical protein BC829DRAFT_465844 [Chytridium lagenaria]